MNNTTIMICPADGDALGAGTSLGSAEMKIHAETASVASHLVSSQSRLHPSLCILPTPNISALPSARHALSDVRYHTTLVVAHWHCLTEALQGSLSGDLTPERKRGMVHVLVSLDLTNAPKKRYDFDKYLADNDWKKLAGVDTVWAIEFPQYTQVSFVAIKDKVGGVLLNVAKELEMERIDYVVQIGNAEVISRYVVKKNGNYGIFIPKVTYQNPA